MSKSNIEWTEKTWNFLAGCSKVSDGCKNCYAIKMANRLAQISTTRKKYASTITDKRGFPNWSGELTFSEETLLAPLKWKATQMVFVNSMSDLFHEKVKDEWLDQAFAVMALTPQHTYQCLTKRPARMLEYFQNGAEKRITSLVYNVTYGQGTDFPGFNKEWRNGNRRSGSNLASQNQGRSKPQAVREGLSASATGVSATRGLSTCDNEREQAADSYGSTSFGVGVLQSPNTGQDDDQSQERRQERQQAGEFGIGDLRGEQETRTGSPQHQSEPPAGQQTSQNTPDRSRCIGDSQVPCDGNDGQRLSDSIQNNHEGDVRNLHSPDVETHLTFPLTNCWLGVSIEDQKTADERIRYLIETPAAIRFLSCEPLLEGLDLTGWLQTEKIHWVIVGGES